MVAVGACGQLAGVQACVDQARVGISQAVALADGIRVGIVDLSGAVRIVAVRRTGVDEERWAVLSERAERLRTACQEVVTHLAAANTATTRAGTRLLRADVTSIERDARLQACALSVATIGMGGSLRLALPVSIRARATLAAVEHGYARRDTTCLVASVETISRCADDLAGIAQLLGAALPIPGTNQDPSGCESLSADH